MWLMRIKLVNPNLIRLIAGQKNLRRDWPIYFVGQVWQIRIRLVGRVKNYEPIKIFKWAREQIS